VPSGNGLLSNSRHCPLVNCRQVSGFSHTIGKSLSNPTYSCQLLHAHSSKFSAFPYLCGSWCTYRITTSIRSSSSIGSL
jgi:hypothetical protein